jgi:DNA topoisomerase-2
MWIFVNALIENPAFDSQTKETLNTKKSQFGSKFNLSEDFVKRGSSFPFLLVHNAFRSSC